MVDNVTDEPDWMVDVTGRVSGDYDYSVTAAMSTITDDNAAPGGDLALAPASITEKGGTSTATIAAVNNDADELDRMVTGMLANSQGAGAVTGTTLTDDDTRGVTLSGSTLTVQENMMGVHGGTGLVAGQGGGDGDECRCGGGDGEHGRESGEPGSGVHGGGIGRRRRR